MSTSLTTEAVPDHGAVAKELQTLITVTNSGATGVTCAKLKFSIPAGDGPNDLTSAGDAVRVTAAPAAGTNWSVAAGDAPSAVTFYATPNADAGRYLGPGAQAGFRFSIPLNARAGTASITVTAYDPSSPPASRPVPITKTAVATADAGTSPQIDSFGAYPPTSPASGKNVTLTWSTTNATSARIKSPSSPTYYIASAKVGSGSTTVDPRKAVTYTLIAYNGGYSTSRQAPVAITPVALTSTVLPTIRCEDGGTAYIRWMMSGASDVKVNGVSVSPASYGDQYQYAVSPTARSTTYTVTAYGYLPNGGSYPSFTCNVVIPYPVRVMATGYTKNHKYYVRMSGEYATAALVLYPYGHPGNSKTFTNPASSSPYSMAYVGPNGGAAIYVRAYGQNTVYAGAVLSMLTGTANTFYAQQLYFYPTATTIRYGEQVTFKWQVPLALYAKLYTPGSTSGYSLTGTPTANTPNGPYGEVFRGAKTFQPTKTATYSLKVKTALGPAQTLQQKVVVLPAG